MQTKRANSIAIGGSISSSISSETLSFRFWIPRPLRVFILARRLTHMATPLLQEAERMKRECQLRQADAFTTFARNKLKKYEREIGQKCAGLRTLCRRESLSKHGPGPMERQFKQLSGLLDSCHQVIRIDGKAREQGSALHAAHVSARDEAASLLIGDAKASLHSLVKDFKQVHSRLSESREANEVHFRIDELESIVSRMKDILIKHNELTSRVVSIGKEMESVDKKEIARDPDAFDRWNRLQATVAAAESAVADGSLLRAQRLVQDADKYLANTSDFLQKNHSYAADEVGLWMSITQQCPDFAPQLRLKLMEVGAKPTGDQLQQWELLKVEFGRIAHAGAIYARAINAKVLRTKISQLAWNNPDPENYRIYARDAYRALKKKAEALPEAGKARGQPTSKDQH